MTCSICKVQCHLSSACPSTRVCMARNRVGHRRRDCDLIARQEGRVWRPVSTQLHIESTPVHIGTCASSPCLVNSHSSNEKTPLASCAPPPSFESPLPRSKSTPMAIYKVDPHRFLPAGHVIVDGGPTRLPRTFVTAGRRPERRHEEYVVAEVMSPPLPEQMGQVREEVADFLQAQGVMVRSVQPSFLGVGLFQLRDAAVKYTLTQHAPFDLGEDRFVRFFNHDQGEGFRGADDYRTGWLMLIGVPLDYRNTKNLTESINTFRKFHSWNSEDPYLVRSMVHASFPSTALVPWDVVFGD